MRSGITRRWLRGNLLITVLVVLLAEAMFLYTYTRSYYGSVQQIMYRRFSSVTGQLKMYTGDTAQSAAASRSLALRRMVEQFADKDKYEFMLLDSYGGVIASSSGTDAEGIVSSKDFEQALNGPDGLGVAVYRTQSGEVVMAACSLVPYDAEDVAALRLVTSLALVERQVKNAIIISVFLAVAILLFTIMSGLYFVRGIVVPLGQVERTAAGIARGELDVRLPLTGDPHDEVDRLRGTINQMAEGLEETEKMKNEFISSVSHELRTPLTSIIGSTSAILETPDLSLEQQHQLLEDVRDDAQWLVRVVENLLSITRMGEDTRITKQSEAAEEVLGEVARKFRKHYPDVKISVAVPDELLIVPMDAILIEQVMTNLLENAVRHGKNTTHIALSVHQDGENAVFAVQDNGGGIPPKLLPVLFSGTLRHSDTPTGDGKRNMGLGLSVCNAIVRAHGGTMHAQNKDGGAEFIFCLPMIEKEPELQ